MITNYIKRISLATFFARLLIVGGAIIFTAAICTPANAGTTTLRVVENKGTVVVLQPETRIFPSTIIIEAEPPPLVVTTIFNEETVLVPVGTITFYNIYARQIEIPQPVDPQLGIDIFWVMAADVGMGIGPLPSGAELLSANLIGSSGTIYQALITPISDLTNLPTFSQNDLLIQWDLSALSQTTGNFFLVKVTIPGNELAVPEPTTIFLLGTGLAGVAIKMRKKLKSRKSGQGTQ